MSLFRFSFLLLVASVLSFGQNTVTPSSKSAAHLAPMPPAKAFPLAHQLAEDYLAGNTAALWSRMNNEMQAGLKSQFEFKQQLGAAFRQVGRETHVDNERVLPILATDMMLYTRLSDFSAAPMKLVTTIVVNSEGKIAGLWLRPAPNPAESKYLDYKPKAQLRFPLTGEWTVYQGGRSVYDNYHAAYADERFAYDLVVIHPDGSYMTGNGTKPEDYFTFGQPVVAAASGKVVEAVDQYDDNPINKPLKDSPKPGNSIVIDHGNGEFTMYAHLKRGSVKVKAGDEVAAGQQIGEVGNSGNSPVPHLHFHMQTTPNWFKGDGLPTPFSNVTVNAKKVASAEPVRGDVVKAE